MYNNTIKLLHSIYNNEYNHENPLSTFIDTPISNMFFSYNEHDVFINQNAPVKYIYILLKGTALAKNSISWTQSDIVDRVKPIDILGLVECLNEQPAYTAYVVAETPCVVFRIPTDVFLSIIKNDALLCYHTLRIFAKVTQHNMDRAETNAIFHSFDRLGHYLYITATGDLPYIYPYTRKKMADDLYINLRTLYRYLNTMEKEQFLTLEHGKIVIYKHNFDKLHAKYGNIVL